MSIEFTTLLLFVTMLLLMLTGLPMAFVLGSVGITFSLLLTGPASLNLVLFTTMTFTGSFIFVAIPLFLFMGNMLERSGIADILFEFFYHLMGSIRGGLAVSTVFICCIFAAMCGVTGAATVSMGLIALPAMLKRGYSKHLATGTVQAGGALGFLIPPSVVMIVYSFVARVSVGKLFLGGIVPGLILATIFVLYIVIRCNLQPQLAPIVSKEKRLSWLEKVRLSKALILPALLVALVLGTIFFGICSPTEASAIGALGSIICAVVNKKFGWIIFYEALSRTAGVTGMLIWLSISAAAYSTVYSYLGAPELISKIFLGITTSKFGILIMIQIVFLIMGCFLDEFAILFICMPILVPIIKNFGYDPIWFGILYVVNMQMAYITPPFGLNLFYMRAVAPKEVSLRDIYISAFPFVFCQAIGLILIMLFPKLVLWLPELILK